MGQKLITDALGADAPTMLYRPDGNVLSYQNSDGSFSRYAGGNGDLLLSALVAENTAVQYNEEALAAFILSKIESTKDRETRLLGYWGAECF